MGDGLKWRTSSNSRNDAIHSMSTMNIYQLNDPIKNIYEMVYWKKIRLYYPK